MNADKKIQTNLSNNSPAANISAPQTLAEGRNELALAWAALLPASFSLIAPILALTGRLAWIAPILAWILWALFQKVLSKSAPPLPSHLQDGFGPFFGKLFTAAYFLWAVFLLTVSARRYSDRLQAVLGQSFSRWFLLAVAFLLALWLDRSHGKPFVRAGRIFGVALIAVMGLVFLLSLSSIRWTNLWPFHPSELAGLPAATLCAFSLTGYWIYALFLPAFPSFYTGKKTARPWTALGFLGFSLLLFVVTGAFGPALLHKMDEPILFLLQGVGLPGAFQRGEAMLTTLLALGDLTLISLLVRAARSLWSSLLPAWKPLRSLWILAAFLCAAILPNRNAILFLSERIVPVGNLLFGLLLPVAAVAGRSLHKKKPARPPQNLQQPN